MDILCMPRSQAAKRYTIRFTIIMVIYLVAIFATTYILKHTHPGRTVAVLLSILPALPIVAVLAVVGLYLKEETDEFQRNLYLQNLLWAAGCVLAFSSVWGLSEMYADIPPIPIFYVFPGFWLFFGICTPLVRRKYRSGPDE